MEEFDQTRLFVYTACQLANFIENNQVNKAELYNAGLPAATRIELEAILDKLQSLKAEDEEAWQFACRTNTIQSYKYYLKVYDVPSVFDKDKVTYRGKHVMDARFTLNQLEEEAKVLRTELFEAMHNSPWKFSAETVRLLINGFDRHTTSEDQENCLKRLRAQDDIASRFIGAGLTISFDEIIEEKLVPSNWTLDKLIAPDYALPQTNIGELGDFPQEKRTDVYFFGVPRGGKSSVLAGIIYEMFQHGVCEYEPQYNHEDRDRCSGYYNGLIRAVDSAKFPISTARDTISFMKISLNVHNRTNHLTFVEIAGEDFSKIAHRIESGPEVWEKLGAAQCLQCKNPKLLFFIIDYSICKGNVRSDSQTWTNMDQALVLTSCLKVLEEDGPDKKNREKDCTLSKVKSVAVIVTKSDLMGDNLSKDERLKVAQEYISEQFQTFMNNLQKACKKYGINKPRNYKPYILTYSLGKLQIGNTYAFDPSDSDNIINFISAATDNTRDGWNIF